MTGFRVDPDALREAIADLKKARRDVSDLGDFARGIDAGELTAGDQATKAFREAIKERAVGDAGSLQTFIKDLSTKLDAKIEAYEATLSEYETLDDAASVDQRRTNPQA